MAAHVLGISTRAAAANSSLAGGSRVPIEGNPFFVHEVVNLLESDGRLEDPDSVESWSVEIPQGVRQVIGRRLSTLSSDCNALLTTAAVMGREFEFPVLARVAELASATSPQLGADRNTGVD